MTSSMDVVVERPLAADWCDDDRRTQWLTEQLQMRIDAGGIDHSHGAQIHLFKGFPVGVQCFIAIGAGGQVAIVRGG